MANSWTVAVKAARQLLQIKGKCLFKKGTPLYNTAKQLQVKTKWAKQKQSETQVTWSSGQQSRLRWRREVLVEAIKWGSRGVRRK